MSIPTATAARRRAFFSRIAYGITLCSFAAALTASSIAADQPKPTAAPTGSTAKAAGSGTAAAPSASPSPAPVPGKLSVRPGNANMGELWTWVFLSWEKVPGAESYDVFRSKQQGDSPEKPIANVTKGTTYRDDGQENVTYYYRIKPVGAAVQADVAGFSNEVNATPKNPLFRDKREYPPLRVQWSADSRLKQVTDVFPHPELLERAVAATASGLQITEDGGRTWSALAGASAGKMGEASDVVFHPALVETFYVASKTKGIWMTADNGKSFTQIATQAGGLASDTVTSVVVYPGDGSHKTLLAAHGEVPGLSRSRDGGKTWDVVNREYCFRRVICGDHSGPYFLLLGSDPKQPDIQKLYSCNTVGEMVTEAMPDILPTGLVIAPVPLHVFYMSTSDNGLQRIQSTEFLPEAAPLPYPGGNVSGWSSVGVTWGASADMICLFLYDTAKLGMVISNDGLATSYTASSGLPTGQFIREGAAIRPNANGTIFYAAVNGALTTGRTTNVPAVRLEPVMFEAPDPNELETEWKRLTGEFGKFAAAQGNTLDAAKALAQQDADPAKFYNDHRLTVTARLPAGSPAPVSVTADLSRFGGSSVTPLLDDGKHGVGVYGFSFAFVGAHRPPPYEWRISYPGRMPLGVTATYEDGRNEGAVGVLSIDSRVHDIDLWMGDGWPFGVKTTGDVTAQAQVLKEAGATSHKAGRILQIAANKGPWTLRIRMPYWLHDITSRPALAITMRLESGEAPKELNVQFQDSPEFSEPTATGNVELLQGVAPVADDHRFVAAIGQIEADSPQFQTTHLEEIVLSGSSSAPGTLVISGLRFLATEPESNPPAMPAANQAK